MSVDRVLLARRLEREYAKNRGHTDFVNALRACLGKGPLPSTELSTRPQPCTWGAQPLWDGNRRRARAPVPW